MNVLLEDLRAFFARLEDDEEGRKVFAYTDHDFQLNVSRVGSFLLKREGQGFAVQEGGEPSPDWRQVTTVDTDEATLRAVMTGRIHPSAALYSVKLVMDGMMANTAYNHCLLRLLRRGAEISR